MDLIINKEKHVNKLSMCLCLHSLEKGVKRKYQVFHGYGIFSNLKKYWKQLKLLKFHATKHGNLILGYKISIP